MISASAHHRSGERGRLQRGDIRMLKDGARRMSKFVASTFLVIVVILATFIVIQYYEPTKQQAAQEASNQGEIKAIDILSSERVAYYTKVLSIFTGVLSAFGLLQIVFLLRADKTARISAQSAKDSSDAALAAQRARFFIVLGHYNLSTLVTSVNKMGHLPSGENVSIQFRFKNYGKTPGILKEQIISSLIASELPDTPPLLLSVKDFPEAMIGSDSPTEGDYYGPHEAPTSIEIGEIGRNNKRFWFYGRLYYDDVFGSHQVHCFYFRSNCDARGRCVLEPIEPKNHPKST